MKEPRDTPFAPLHDVVQGRVETIVTAEFGRQHPLLADLLSVAQVAVLRVLSQCNNTDVEWLVRFCGKAAVNACRSELRAELRQSGDQARLARSLAPKPPPASVVLTTRYPRALARWVKEFAGARAERVNDYVLRAVRAQVRRDLEEIGVSTEQADSLRVPDRPNSGEPDSAVAADSGKDTGVQA